MHGNSEYRESDIEVDERRRLEINSYLLAIFSNFYDQQRSKKQKSKITAQSVSLLQL